MTGEHLFSRADLRDLGIDRPERDEGLARARRDVFLPMTRVPDDPRQRYLLRLQAANRTLIGHHVFSHESAAAVLGLPSLAAWPDRVHLVCERRSGGRSQLDVIRHCIGLEDVEPVLVDGLLVTGIARTAFDLALTRPFAQAGVAADAAFRLDETARAEFAALLDSWGRRRGHRAAGAVLRFADARSGSAGESLSRVEIERAGFVPPDLQVPIVSGGRTEHADFGWPATRTLGEFDGEVKYRDDRYRLGGTVEDVVIREKNRENRLRRVWPNLARWDRADIRQRRLEPILLTAGVEKRSGPSPFARYVSPPRGR